MDFFSTIDQLPVNEIKPLVLLNVLGRMESRGATEHSREVRERCSEFRYAFVTSRTEYNPAADLTCQIKECQILRSVMFRIITAIVCLVLAFSVTAWIKPVTNSIYGLLQNCLMSCDQIIFLRRTMNGVWTLQVISCW